MLRSVLMDENEGLYIDINLKDIEHRIDNIKKRYVLYPFPEGTTFKGYAYGLFKRTQSDNYGDITLYDYRIRYDWKRLQETGGTYIAPYKKSHRFRVWYRWYDESGDWHVEERPYDKYSMVTPMTYAFGVEKYMAKRDYSYTDVLKKVFYCHRRPTHHVPTMCHGDEADYGMNNTSSQIASATLDTKTTYIAPCTQEDFEFEGGDKLTSEFGPCFFDSTGKMYARKRDIVHPTSGVVCEAYVPMEYGLPLGLKRQREGRRSYSYYSMLGWQYSHEWYAQELTGITKNGGKIYDLTGMPILYNLNRFNEATGRPASDLLSAIDTIAYKRFCGDSPEPLTYEEDTEVDWQNKFDDRQVYEHLPEEADAYFTTLEDAYWEQFNDKASEEFAVVPPQYKTDYRIFEGDSWYTPRYTRMDEADLMQLTDIFVYDESYMPIEQYVVKRLPSYDRYLTCRGITSLSYHNGIEIDYNIYDTLRVPERLLPNLGYFNGTTPIDVIDPVVVDDTIDD